MDHADIWGTFPDTKKNKKSSNFASQLAIVGFLIHFPSGIQKVNLAVILISLDYLRNTKEIMREKEKKNEEIDISSCSHKEQFCGIFNKVC